MSNMQDYIIEYFGPCADGQQIKDQGWRIYALTYAKSHMGNAIKRRNQRPYRKFIAVLDSEQAAKTYVAKLGEHHV